MQMYCFLTYIGPWWRSLTLSQDISPVESILFPAVEKFVLHAVVILITADLAQNAHYE